MKKFFVISLLLCACFAFQTSATNLVQNPGFELGAGTGSTRNYTNTTAWYNWGQGLNQNQVARVESTATGSSFIGRFTDGYDISLAGTAFSGDTRFDRAAFDNRTHSQRTESVIAEGDFFNVQYQWVDGFNWVANQGELRVVLFTTDTNTLGGNVTWSSIHDSGLISTPGEWETVSFQTSVFDQSQAGRELFIAFPADWVEKTRES